MMRSVTTLALTLALTALGLGAAERADAQAADALMARQTELQRELARPASAARERRLTRLLDRTIDYEMIVRRVLVVHWDALDEARRVEVTDLLTRAIRHRYRASVDGLRGWEVAVASDEPRGIGRRVETRAARAEERRRIGYDLYQRDGAWRVVDLLVDGEGLIQQYRTQFNHVIRREGWDGFLTRLRARVESESS